MFIHLHSHFVSSFSDSALRIEDALRKVKKDGQPAIAMTDHGEIPFAVPFGRACREAGIKPIFGAELYFVENAQETIQKEINERYHLVALARNRTGLKNLFSLLSDAWLLNSYKERRGLVDWQLLEKYHEGLILLSGCYFNIVGQHATRQGPEAGDAVFRRFTDIFGGDFHIEIGRHYVDEEDKVFANVLALTRRFNHRPVLTNDVHYLDAEDWLVHDVIIKTRYERLMDFKSNSIHYWLKTEEEMRALGFPEEYLAATLDVAARCDDLSIPPLPALAPPSAFDADALVASGEAAYLGNIVYIDDETAERNASGALGKDNPQAGPIAEKIRGIPRRIEPDAEHIVCTPGRQLKETVPLRRSMGKIITQWDRQSCQEAGALILPVAASPLADQLKRFIK